MRKKYGVLAFGKNQCSFYLLEWNACKCEGSDSLFHCTTAKLILLLGFYKWLQNWRGIVNKVSTKFQYMLVQSVVLAVTQQFPYTCTRIIVLFSVALFILHSICFNL